MRPSPSELKQLKKEQSVETPDATDDKVVSSKPKSILEALERIVELAEKSNLSDEFYAKASTYIKYASRKLKLTSVQTVLLALFVDKSEDYHIHISELAEYIGCRTTKMLRLSNDIDVLEDNHYIRASRSDKSLSYRVPLEVLTSLKKNEPYIYVAPKISDTTDFFDAFDRLAREKDDGELTYDNFKILALELLKSIKNSVLNRELEKYSLVDDDKILFLFMTHLFVENNDDNIGFHDLYDLYDDRDIPSWVKRSLRNRDNNLFRLQLIENANEDGMARSDAFKLTEQAKDTLLSELNITRIGSSISGLISPDTLSEKHLIYNKEEQKQISVLSSILEKERFAGVQERLQKAGMRPGFCCLFYGAPGTGKTETVYQLARQTGRSIMRVDVDKIKSYWVGESEKNIKILFDRYRNICKNSQLAPILLFNEADAVLGVRMEGASHAVDKMENSIQNIILQEMESLDGIMIATTNLTTNLDKAFERRFLYKIRFDKPTVEARSEIWKVMLPGLSAEEASKLALNFDLSGGEIENIARKHSVSAILSGSETIDINAIMESCRHERINNIARPRIGF